MDEASWLALTATLTLLGGAWTVYAARHRGAASALRGAGLTLLVPALYLTDTLATLVDIGAEITSWATRLVFSPTVWLGVVLGGVAVLLLGASSVLRGRELARSEGAEAALPDGEASGQAGARGTSPGKPPATHTGKAPAKRPGSGAGGDDELAEIEELLRRRGIT